LPHKSTQDLPSTTSKRPQGSDSRLQDRAQARTTMLAAQQRAQQLRLGQTARAGRSGGAPPAAAPLFRAPGRSVAAPRPVVPLARPRPLQLPAAAAAAAGDVPGPYDPAAALHLPLVGPPSAEPSSSSNGAGGGPRGGALRARYNKARAAFASEYDKELFSLALPALASMLLDPIMNVISACESQSLVTWRIGKGGGLFCV
jgi:hypothetical protein